MKHRTVRVVLAVVVVLASLGAAYHVYRTAQQIGRIHAAAQAFDQATQKILEETATLKAALRAYVAPGQGLSFWSERVGQTLAALDADLTDLRTAATLPETRTAAESARAAARQLADMDVRIRKGLRIGDTMLAADSIFSEGEQGTANLVRQVEDARARQLAEYNNEASALERREALLASSAVLLLMLSVIALVPIEHAARADAAPQPPAPASPDDSAAPRDTMSELRIADGSPAPAPDIDVEAAARLCGEIARLDSPAGLPMVLERAAMLLDASGVVLWAASGGVELTAALTHGYSQQAIARMPTIACDANNVTAVAFRTGQVQFASGDMVTHGALAAPLGASGGTVGVLTAEMRNNGELQPARRALAAIIASQLATVLGGAPSPGTPS
ncbi:MAG TPA: hypothetical protein VIC33_14080 [Vicinamibacterales bacterium]